MTRPIRGASRLLRFAKTHSRSDQAHTWSLVSSLLNAGIFGFCGRPTPCRTSRRRSYLRALRVREIFMSFAMVGSASSRHDARRGRGSAGTCP